jgi:hypothetical protein
VYGYDRANRLTYRVSCAANGNVNPAGIGNSGYNLGMPLYSPAAAC